MNLRFMLGFDIEKVGEIKCEKPDPEMHSKRSSEIWTGPKERWIFQLDEDYWIWCWKEDGVELLNQYLPDSPGYLPPSLKPRHGQLRPDI